MDALVDLSWRLYPAAALMAAGLALLSHGLLRGFGAMRRPRRDASKMASVIRGFRLAVVGLALAALGAAWAWHMTWLLVLALVIGGEETLESTLIIFALTRGRHLRLRINAPRPWRIRGGRSSTGKRCRPSPYPGARPSRERDVAARGRSAPVAGRGSLRFVHPSGEGGTS